MIIEAWNTTLQRKAAAPALRDESGAVLRTFDALEADARRWEGALEGFEAERGEVIALQVGNGPEAISLLIASWRRGLCPVMIGMHTGAQERETILKTTGATLLARREGVGRIGFPRSLWGGEPAPALLKLTSGTTAAPRAIRFSARALLEDAAQICESMGLQSDDLNYGVIPISHSYGFSNLVTPLIAHGIAMVLSEDRMPRAILNGLNQSGATVFPGMPIFFDKLAALEGDLALPRLRLAISAGAPLTPEVGERFTAKYGVPIRSFYGSSECGGIAYVGGEFPGYREGFVGQSLSRVRLEAGEEGRFTVEGSTVGDGYWSAFGPVDAGGLEPGRFSPDDLLREEPEGYYLAGRASDFINIAGRKLNPREVEAQLLECPGVREVVVFAVPSALRHEEAVACVVGEVDPAELARQARQRLSGWQVPKDFWVLPEIPRNERGKINRRELAQEWQKMRG